MAEEKKVFIRGHQWGTIFANVQDRGKTLRDEALRFGTDEATLIKMGDEKFPYSSEWEKCKRVSAQREKKQVLKKTLPAQMNAPAPMSAQTTDTAPTPAPEPMEELLRKKEELQKELVTCTTSLEEANAILEIRQGSLEDAQAVLKKAEAAVQQAQSDVDEAQQAVRQAQAQQEEAQQALQLVEEEIQKNQVYLIAPWYSGELPTFGTFISTVEMEGVQVLEAADTIEPDFKDMVSADFNQVSEYVLALRFVSLVQDFILNEKTHRVLNTDPRVKKLLDKHIG